MLTKYRYVIRNMLFVVLFLAVALISFFFKISPIAFQKSVMIVPSESKLSNIDLNNVNHSAPDVRKLISPIPYQSGKVVFDVLPRDRYHKTIEMGFGNCSNLSFGMAVWLLQSGSEYEIVHFIPYDSFLMGNGHTMLNMPYTLDGMRRVGLVDVMEGGVPRANGSFVDLEAALGKSLNHPSIMPLNERKDEVTVYYGDFLNKSAIGIVPSDEVARYFRFLNRVYIPLGNKKLERIFYSGVAIVLGLYPHTYVSSTDYTRLFADKMSFLLSAHLLLWLVRAVPLLIILLLLAYFSRAKTHESKKSQLQVNLSP